MYMYNCICRCCRACNAYLYLHELYSLPPVFDHFQYTNTDGEGLGDLVIPESVVWWACVKCAILSVQQ